ncbi:unnamed protein product [Ambrosiozyma monospora]|uniref:Transcription initiation factor TFIID subunit 8 n=1 Tax=Ambrosiozyma monospora TaxID=43982 RepID=A0A9W6T3G1_AMBMO|nr:unnamed protein product [Ambrosiozyma monospora]
MVGKIDSLNKDESEGFKDKEEISVEKIYQKRQTFVDSQNIDIRMETLEQECEPMDNVMKACIAMQLDSILGVSIKSSALAQLTNLTIEYMNCVFENLRKLTEVQRRKSPAKIDLKLLLKEGYFDLGGVEDEFNKCKKLGKKELSKIRKANKMAKLLSEVLDKPLEPDDDMPETDPRHVFFSDVTSTISQVIPPTVKVSSKLYIPNWMPPLPPDHTYKSTPQYTRRIEDPRELKKALVYEGRLGERALHRILR